MLDTPCTKTENGQHAKLVHGPNFELAVRSTIDNRFVCALCGERFDRFETSQFRVGQKLTIISISEMMANTVKREVTVTSVLEYAEKRLHYVNGPLVGWRVGSYKQRGKRKEFYLDIKTDSLVFEGWDLPIKTDSEVANRQSSSFLSFSGNACFNLAVVTPDATEEAKAALLRTFIEERNLNGQVSDEVKAKVVHVLTDAEGYRASNSPDEGMIPLYPELETNSATMNRIKDRFAAA